MVKQIRIKCWVQVHDHFDLVAFYDDLRRPGIADVEPFFLQTVFRTKMGSRWKDTPTLLFVYMIRDFQQLQFAI